MSRSMMQSLSDEIPDIPSDPKNGYSSTSMMQSLSDEIHDIPSDPKNGYNSTGQEITAENLIDITYPQSFY
jgi:hypothetical protein